MGLGFRLVFLIEDRPRRYDIRVWGFGVGLFELKAWEFEFRGCWGFGLRIQGLGAVGMQGLRGFGLPVIRQARLGV